MHRLGRMTVAIFFLLTAPALADKPEKGDRPGKGPPHAERGRDDRSGKPGGSSINFDIRFGDNDRVAVRDYFDLGHGRGCPPGLAKKSNGCLPPGQAKKWAVGRPLPRDVVFYDLPPELVVRLRPPPAGYRYVRVAADILMIAVGTGMVLDAIEDLGRL